jgi:hypothetical protein
MGTTKKKSATSVGYIEQLNPQNTSITAASLHLLHCINLAVEKTLHEHQVSKLTFRTSIR